ncbi:hypothetical protein Ancab_016620 [Ancistrocladus abbreviatus]
MGVISDLEEGALFVARGLSGPIKNFLPLVTTCSYGVTESNKENITFSQCFLFWDYILRDWSSETEKILKQKLTRVPVVSSSDGHVLPVSKHAAFIRGDLLLKKLFVSAGDSPLFVRLAGISISAIKLSEIRMPADKRHSIVKTLLHLPVLANAEKIPACYEVCLGANRTAQIETKKMVHWDKKSQCLVVNKESYGIHRTGVLFASWFAQEIAEGLLPEERTGAISYLCNLIEMGFLSQFRDKPVDCLLTRENIELSLEDEEFLMTAFLLGEEPRVSSLVKCDSTRIVQLAPSTPFPPQERTHQV